MDIIGNVREVRIGSHSKVSATIFERIGTGWLGRTDFGTYLSIHYDFCGRLQARRMFDSETDARKEALDTSSQKS